MKPRVLILAFLALSPLLAQAAANFTTNVARPLHFYPEDGAFVVENGAETFNRPLYGLNTAFRVDGGDRPEFSLYLPGRGGNLRIGIKTVGGAKWLIAAAKIVMRYGDGELRYEISDPLLGEGKIKLTVVAMDATEGLLVRAELVDSAAPCELIFAYGGANGQRGNRDGDIGCEKVPVAQFFQLQPGACAGSRFEIGAPGFSMHSKAAEIVGLVPEGTQLSVASAEKWASPAALLASPEPATKTPVIVGSIPFTPGHPLLLALQRLSQPGGVSSTSAAPQDYQVSALAGEGKSGLNYLLAAYKNAGLSAVFAAAERHWHDVSHQVTVETPDLFINAAVPALCLAADGVWDSRQHAFMHGAVAWRTKLLGWRGAYAGDELGWHDRTQAHLLNWLPRQNTDPIPAGETGEPSAVPPDESVRLARNEPALHSNGDLTKSHYDMNLAAIDILFRHLLWTGDLDFARKNWPVIERHLAWERRLFRRPFGPDQLPLYEAYCCIWASDDLQYEGGGATHATAYNYFHNQMAATVAKLIGKDPKPYEQEADLIRRAMHEYLWLPDRGWFAECKDLLGLQLVHPNAALWTFYHLLDSEAATPLEAWQMTRFVDTQLPHIPLEGPGVPAGDFFTLPTTTWMPYRWSTNNVVMAESAHTALGYWQAGRGDMAFRLYKGLLLDSMFMGLCPGNVGMCTQFDMARGEAQRDFADGVGMTSRALVEGLFGVRPDELAGVLTVQPGFPADWDHASMRHPDFSFGFRRTGLSERYEIESRFPKPMALRLVVPALRDQVAGVTLNGQLAKWRVVEAAVGMPRVEIQTPATAKAVVAISWSGAPLAATAKVTLAAGGQLEATFSGAKIVQLSDPQKILAAPAFSGSWLRATVTGTPGARTAFAQLQQGQFTWFAPIKVTVPAKAPEVYPMTDWSKTPSVKGRLECVDLGPVLNDRVTQIFHNEYRSPRSPYCSLALPLQGIGSWIQWKPTGRLSSAKIDDTGLRAAAAKAGGRFVLPQGIPFQTAGPGDAKNVAFVSQWDNYPREINAPLTGRATHLYLLMAGSTNPMQSRFDNGEVVVTYADGSTDRLALENPTTWWPIEQDYLIDDYAFRRPGPIPLRVDLQSGKVRLLAPATFQGRGGFIEGGAATVLDFALQPGKSLKSLTVRALANDVVIGLLSATLLRPEATSARE